MPAANQSDFFGEGTAAAAFAPQETPAQAAERARLERIRRAEEIRLTAEKTAERNAPYQNEVRAYQPEQARQESITRNSKAGEAGNDWLYPGIVAGTIVGGIAAGGIVGAAGGTAAATSAIPAITTAGGVTAPTIAAPVAAGLTAPVAAGLTAGGTTAAAASPWLTPGNVLGAASLTTQVGGMIYNQIRTKAEKDLIKKQEEIAAAADARRAQVQQEGMNRLGQTMLAMNPMNQTMADMFGPSAAYSPDQMAAMVADPGAVSWEEAQALGSATDPESQAKVQRALADKKRQDMVRANTTPLGPGPAPLQQRTPQAARRF